MYTNSLDYLYLETANADVSFHFVVINSYTTSIYNSVKFDGEGNAVPGLWLTHSRMIGLYVDGFCFSIDVTCKMTLIGRDNEVCLHRGLGKCMDCTEDRSRSFREGIPCMSVCSRRAGAATRRVL